MATSGLLAPALPYLRGRRITHDPRRGLSGRPRRRQARARAAGSAPWAGHQHRAERLVHGNHHPTSTSAQASVFRPEAIIAGRDTKILIDQIRTIDVSYVAGELVDYLSRDDMAQVEHSLSRYFGLLR